MMRLTQSMKLDTALQTRNYLYHIVVVVAAISGGAMGYFLDKESVQSTIPLFFLFATAASGYLFIGALVLFEKRENTLTGLIVTPLRPREYILSKLATLSLIGIVESVVVLIAGYIIPHGFDFNPLWMLLGIVLMSLVYALIGFIVVVRMDSINNFLIPSVAIALVAQLPATAVWGIWEPFFYYLIPTFPPLQLLLAAFQPVEAWRLAYGLIGSAVVGGALYVWSERAFQRHIIEK